MSTQRSNYLDLLDEMYVALSNSMTKVDGVMPWPLIRIQTGYTLILLGANKIEPTGITTKFSFKKTSFSINDVLTATKLWLHILKTRLRSSGLLSNKVLLFGYKEHYYKQDDKYVNAYISPLKNELDKSGILNEELIVSNSSATMSNSELADIYCLILKYHRLKFKIENSWTGNNQKSFENAKLIKDYLDSKEIESTEHVASIVYLTQIEHVINYNAFKSLLRIVQPKAIWTYCYYDNTMMSLIRAANDLEINTIEYQHSVQGDEHNAYSKWRDIEKHTSFFPRTFWLWKQQDAERIIKNFSGLNFKPQAFTGGNIAVIQQLERSFNRSSESLSGILVCLQGLWIPKFVEEVISNDATHLWYFRLHPRYPEDKEKLMELKNRFPEKIEMEDANRLPIYDLFNRVSISITDYSGSALEAEEFGIKVIIVGEKGAEIFKEKIANGKYILCYDSDKLIAGINRKPFENESSTGSVIKDRQNLDKVIATIFK